MEPKLCAVGDVGGWISKGWNTYKTSWLTWTLMMVIYFVCMVVLSVIPVIGPIGTAFINPIILGGMLVAAHNSRSGAAPQISDMFMAFSNPAMRTPLFTLGAISVGIHLISGLIAGGSLLGASAIDPSNPTALAGGFGLAVLVSIAISLVGAAALWFAVPLVAISAVAPVDAIKLSFSGTIKNVIPLIIFSIVLGILVFCGMLLFFVGLLITGPIAALAHYHCFSDIYGVS